MGFIIKPVIRKPVTDGRWRYYCFSELGTDERIYFVGRCLGPEEGEWGGCSEGRSRCTLYQNQDGLLYLCFKTDETPYRRHSGDYVKVWSLFSLQAETREGLLDLHLRSFDSDDPEIPRLVATVPEVKAQHLETDYGS
jgi:hypothetical protein